MSIYWRAINKTHAIKIEQDNHAEYPFEDCDQVADVYIWHRRYSFGKKHKHRSISEFFQALLDDANSGHSFDFCDRMTGEAKGYQRVMKALEKHYLILPIYGYDHGSLTISTGAFADRWDSSQFGWIVQSLKNTKEWRGVKRLTQKVKEDELNSMRSMVETIDAWLQGNVYGFSMYTVNREVLDIHLANNNLSESDIEWADFVSWFCEEWDSCWGFYGDDHKSNGIADHLPQDAQELLDKLEQRQIIERIQRVYA